MSGHYCLECGKRMEFREIEDMLREQCPNCGWIYFRQLKVGVIVLIEDAQGRLLLAKRGHNPWKEYWNLPAGYVEFNEPPEQAAVREVREETGLEVELTRQVGTYFYDDDPRGNGLLVAFTAKVTGGELSTNTESLAFGYFSRDDLPENICGAAHDVIVAAWKEGRLP